MAVLNGSAGSRFGKTIKSTNPKEVWKQDDIGCGWQLYGFFLFELKRDKKDVWNCNIKSASKTNILTYINYSGYRKVYMPKSNEYKMVSVEDNVITIVTADLIRNKCYAEVKQRGSITIKVNEDTQFDFNAKLLDTIYLQNQDQIFNKNFLELLEEFKVLELRDTRFESYFLFQNTIINVTPEAYKLMPYNKLIELDRCVWKSHIMERDFTNSDNLPISEFQKFLQNVSAHDDKRMRATMSSIGYLLHHYNGSHLGQAVVLYDEQPTDVKNPQGGTGKGVFSQAIAQMRETVKIDGKHYQGSDRFRFQPVMNTTQVVWVDDLSKDQDFDSFFSAITDGFTIEKKNQDLIQIQPERSPKMLFSMNTVIAGSGSSHLRRIFVLEFANYYSKKLINGSEKPIADEHGHFFDRYEWTAENWDSFTKFMIGCTQFYLQNGLQPYELINVGRNSLIQQTSTEFLEWVEEQNFQLNTYYKTKQHFEDYRNRYFGDNSEFVQRSFVNMIKKYAPTVKWEVKIVTDNGTLKLSEFVFTEKVNSLQIAI